MKLSALIIGILGSILIFALGVKWVSDYNENKKILATAKQISKYLDDNTEMTAQLNKLENTKTAGYFMIVLGLAALVASPFVFKKAKISAIILLAAAVIPALFSPQSLIFGFLLIIAAILAYAGRQKEMS